MKPIRLALVVALLAFTIPDGASRADPSIRRVSHPGSAPSIVIAGVTLTCPTSTGGYVWWIVTQPGVGPVGLHHSRGGVSWNPGAEPHIFLRADLFGALPPQVQLYIALHECAHFHLPPAQNSELNADCWTIRTALANRWLTLSDIEFVRTRFEASGNVADWGHPGTLIHYENIAKCLSGR